MKNTFFTLFLLFTVQIGLTQSTTTQNIGSFSVLKVYDKITVKLIPSSEEKVEISGNKSKEVQIVNKNGELKIRMNTVSIMQGEGVSVLLYYKEIKSIYASEGSSIKSNEDITTNYLILNAKEGADISLTLNVKKLKVLANSGGKITTDGSATNQDILITSGGSFQGKDLTSNEASVTVNAGGSATVNASSLVDAKTRAGGNIIIYGNPKDIKKKTTAGGNITVK